MIGKVVVFVFCVGSIARADFLDEKSLENIPDKEQRARLEEICSDSRGPNRASRICTTAVFQHEDMGDEPWAEDMGIGSCAKFTGAARQCCEQVEALYAQDRVAAKLLCEGEKDLWKSVRERKAKKQRQREFSSLDDERVDAEQNLLRYNPSGFGRIAVIAFACIATSASIIGAFMR